MHRDSAFWNDQDRSERFRGKQGAILKESGRAVDMQVAARRIRMLNLGYFLINQGFDISTFDLYVSARKESGRRCPSVPGQVRKFEREFGSYEAFYQELRSGNHQVLQVTEIGESDVYSIEVDDPEPDDKRTWSEHNYVIAPMGSTGHNIKGCVVFNSRRAAKMQTLHVSHPDIMDFVRAKSREDEKARILVDGGIPGGLNGEASETVCFQNCNMSVRVSDAFMRAVEDDADWSTVAVTTGSSDGMPRYRAREIMRGIAEGTWRCGDPGMQFDDTINFWHTSIGSGRIYSSNPCLRRGTRLLTRNGWRKVEELASLDSVDLFDGISFVSGKVWHTGQKPVVRLHTNNGRALDVTKDHEIYTNAGWIKAESTKGLPIPYVFPNVMIEGSTQLVRCITGGSGKYYAHTGVELMESLGFLQGDGSIRDNHTVIVYYTPEKDRDFVSRVVLPTLSDIAADKNESYDPSPLSEGRNGYAICRKKLADWLRAIGFDTRNLPERILPSSIWAMKPKSQSAFLRGLFGANGNVLCDARDAVVLVSSCRDMLNEVQLILQILGIASSVRVHNKEQDIEWKNGIYTSQESYHLEITNAHDIAIFARKIGFPQKTQSDRLEKISQIVLEPPKAADSYRTKSSIVDIEDLNIEDDVYDFRCSTTSAGMANGIIVHNCSEFLDVNETACNLASINLMKFRTSDGFDCERFRAACRLLITAQDILVDLSSYPTEPICRNSHELRPLGLGYCGLGALAMSYGYPYDSDGARFLAASVTSLMTAESYTQSAKIASAMGPFAQYEQNRDSMDRVIYQHATSRILGHSPQNINNPAWAAERAWIEAIELRTRYGYRNDKVTLLAPTGTIAFMMDSGDSTGIEPFLSVVQYKTLSGGGFLKIVNTMVPQVLTTLGYDDADIEQITRHIETYDTIEDVIFDDGSVDESGLHPDHLAIFDASFPPKPGVTESGIPFRPREGRFLSMAAHIGMMAAAQPFLSGAISKTVNAPNSATVEDIEAAYMLAWKSGLKAIAIFRDGSKESQPVQTGKANRNDDREFIDDGSAETIQQIIAERDIAVAERDIAISGKKYLQTLLDSTAKLQNSGTSDVPERRRLGDNVPTIRHKFSIDGYEGYLHVGLYPEGQPAEIFVTMAKEGSTLGGLMDAWATSISLMLQYGIPLSVIEEKFANANFSPSGFTKNPELIPRASSPTDYIVRWLRIEFDPEYRAENLPRNGKTAPIPLAESFMRQVAQADPDDEVYEDRPAISSETTAPSVATTTIQRQPGPPCRTCGHFTTPNGANCWVCQFCGSTSGGCGG